MDRRRATVAIVVVALALALGLGIRLRVAKDWAFFGSDTYGYFRLAQEWTAEGRFAQGAPPEELQWYRRPLYPAFVALIAVDHATPWKAPQHRRILWVQSLMDVLVTGLLAFFCARRLAGRAAGFVALFIAMLCPFTIPYDSAVLTETVAMCLTMCAIVPLILGRDRPMRWFPVAAVAVALSGLLRPEGPVLGTAFIPAILMLPPAIDWRRRARVAAVSAVVFAALFAPWPIRNLRQFGSMHLSDGMIDRTTHHVTYPKGYWDWLKSWAADYRPFEFTQSCFYDLKCAPYLQQYDAIGAFAGDAPDRAAVDKLLAERRASSVTKPINDAFAELAHARFERHPLKVLIGLPLARALKMWIGPQDELFGNPNWRPWKSVSTHLLPAFGVLQALLLLTALGGLIALGWRQANRHAVWVIATALVSRTAVLAWTGFCLPRYLQPIYGLLFVLAAVGSVEAVRATRHLIRRRAAA